MIAGVTIILLSRNVAGFAEWHSEHIFPVFTNSVGMIFSLLPFSLFEVGVYTCIAGTLFYIIYLFILLIVPSLRKKLKKAAINGICVFLVVLSTSFMMLASNCIVNYDRATYAQMTNQKIMPSTKEELLSLCNILISDAKDLAGSISVDEDGLFTTAGMDIKKEARNSMQALGEENAILSGHYPNPKPILSSKLMSMMNLTGIYSPITIEANYNKDVLDYVMPYTICHELAHLKGFIREDEAGFIAYAACMKSETPEFRYSGTLSALEYTLTAYYREATSEEYARLCVKIPEQVRRDILANNVYWQQYQGKIAGLAEKANDSYLKVNAQEGGVKSYGRMVDLLLAEHRIGAEGI